MRPLRPLLLRTYHGVIDVEDIIDMPAIDREYLFQDLNLTLLDTMVGETDGTP